MITTKPIPDTKPRSSRRINTFAACPGERTVPRPQRVEAKATYQTFHDFVSGEKLRAVAPPLKNQIPEIPYRTTGC